LILIREEVSRAGVNRFTTLKTQWSVEFEIGVTAFTSRVLILSLLCPRNLIYIAENVRQMSPTLPLPTDQV
jgi:hypothetical protein